MSADTTHHRRRWLIHAAAILPGVILLIAIVRAGGCDPPRKCIAAMLATLGLSAYLAAAIGRPCRLTPMLRRLVGVTSLAVLLVVGIAWVRKVGGFEPARAVSARVETSGEPSASALLLLFAGVAYATFALLSHSRRAFSREGDSSQADSPRAIQR